MAANDCIDAVRKAAGKADLDEITEMLETLEERIKSIMARDESLSMEEAALKAAEELGRDAELSAIIEKRNAYINYRRKSELKAFIRNNFADHYGLGLESFLVGTNLARTSSRFSVAAEQKSLSQSYIAGLLYDLDKGGYHGMVANGAMDREISRALWEVRKDEPNLKGISHDAVEIANIFAKWQEKARIDANRAGAFIAKREDYITRQSHDPYKMHAAGREEWIAKIRPLLDSRTFQGVDNPDQFLIDTYNALVSGKHFKSTPGALEKTDTPKKKGFKGPGNLAKKVSAERVLHFKDADAWFDYNVEFGSDSLRESVLGALDHLGQSTALMRKLGTNPEFNWNAALDELENDLKGSNQALSRLQTERTGKLRKRFAEVDGSTRMVVSQTMAKYGSTIRSVESMAKLGGATISAVSDIPVAASELNYQGIGFLESMGNLLTGLLKKVRTQDRQEVLSSLGVYLDSMRGDITNRFSADDTLPGMMSRWQNNFFKLNLLRWWTDNMRSSAALMMSHNLAFKAGKTWDELGHLARALDMYGIDSGKWDMMRSSTQTAADGKKFMTTEGIDDIPDARIAQYLTENNRKPTDAAINEIREEMRSQLRSFITDRASYAVIEPDARTRSIMRQGTQPGTPEGELLRFIGQFKAFPAAILQKTVGRELFGRGYQPTEYGTTLARSKELWNALTSGKGEKLGIVQLMVWTTAFGYLAMSGKDLMKGRQPRDPTDPKTWGAAMLQGGALGIYGDFLLGDMNRFGGGPIQTLAGPAIGVAEDVIQLGQKMRDGDDFAASAFKLALNNTPFINLFYTRIALDYLFFYRIQEWLNPGYLRRMERRVKKENSQEFLIKPSSVAG